MVNKLDSNDPRQLSLFGELRHSSNPSIATFPEFDQALNNLIKLSDLGAFIEINIQGFEKGYTLNLSESIIPKDFLKLPKNYSPITVQLFSHDLRNELKKLTASPSVLNFIGKPVGVVSKLKQSKSSASRCAALIIF